MSSEQSISQFYMHSECCCRCRRCYCRCSVCCYTAVVASAGVVLLPGTVRHRVPDGDICCWFIESDPSVFFLFIQTRFIFVYPLAVLSLLLPRFAYILGNYGHARSQGGCRPVPPCRSYYIVKWSYYSSRLVYTVQNCSLPAYYCSSTYIPGMPYIFTSGASPRRADVRLRLRARPEWSRMQENLGRK